MYVIDEFHKTPAVPYGDTFQLITRYCITWTSPDSCHLLITGGIQWIKNPLVKGLIKAPAMKGLTETAKATLEVVSNELLSNPKMIKRGEVAKQKTDQQPSLFLPVQYGHIALIIGLIIVLVSLMFYDSYSFKYQTSKQQCDAQFSINNWITSESPNQILKSKFVKSNFLNGTIKSNITFKSSELRKNFDKYSKYLVNSRNMASAIMDDWILLNKIEELSIEALYQNWILNRLSSDE
jgi:hypothetical protein